MSDNYETNRLLLEEIRKLQQKVDELSQRDTRTREEIRQDEEAYEEWKRNEGR